VTPFEIGICAGIVWSSVLVVWTLAELPSGEPSPYLLLICCIYEGFDLSMRGLLKGAMWAFADGFISGWVISWLFSFLW